MVWAKEKLSYQKLGCYGSKISVTDEYFHTLDAIMRRTNCETIALEKFESIEAISANI